MLCETCGEAFEGLQCACGWKVPRLEVPQPKRHFVLQECSHAGCTVLVRSLLGTQPQSPICKWHLAGQAYNAHNIKEPPPGDRTGPFLSKDEFGRTLFEAIETNAERLAAESQGKKEIAASLLKQLTPMLSKIDDREAVQRIMKMR